jgi:hypothetical protein
MSVKIELDESIITLQYAGILSLGKMANDIKNAIAWIETRLTSSF